MAVYTQLSESEVATHLARHYALGDLLSLNGIAEGVENSNFLLRTTQGKFILTLYEKRVKETDLPFFIGLMDHLSAGGIACPQPVHGVDGQAIYALNNKRSCIVTFLEGKSVRSIQAAHLLCLGRMLARMHLAGEGFSKRRPNALSLTGWQELAARIDRRFDVIRLGLEATVAQELGYLKAHWPQDLPSGIIHADAFPDNVFFLPLAGGMNTPELSGIIDFYFACNDMWMYDLAICLNAWCFEASHAFNITRAGALLRGYHAVRPIEGAELEALPVLARGAALRFLLTRAYDWLNPTPDALVKPKDPLEYVKKLSFHQQVKSHGEYGL